MLKACDFVSLYRGKKRRNFSFLLWGIAIFAIDVGTKAASFIIEYTNIYAVHL